MAMIYLHKTEHVHWACNSAVSQCLLKPVSIQFGEIDLQLPRILVFKSDISAISKSRFMAGDSCDNPTTDSCHQSR